MPTSVTPTVIATPSAAATPILPKGRIRFRSLSFAALSVFPLAEGEPGFATDTLALMIGSKTGNVVFVPYDPAPFLARIIALEEKSSQQEEKSSQQEEESSQQSVLNQSLLERITTLEAQVMSYSAKSQLNWRGAYNAATVYALNDEVYYQGSTIVSLQAGNTGNTPPIAPAVATAYWGYVSQAGATGSTGASAASGINQRSFNASQNPIAAPATGTTLDEITFDLTAGTALTATLYARQLTLDTRIKVFGTGTLTVSPASGTIDGAATIVLNGVTKDAYILTADPTSSTNLSVS